MSLEQGAIPVLDPVELGRTAREIYQSVREAGGLHSIRTICIEDVSNGDADSYDMGYVIWREATDILAFTRYNSANTPSTGWYKEMFEEEVLQSGFIIFRKDSYIQSRSIIETLVVFHE